MRTFILSLIVSVTSVFLFPARIVPLADVFNPDAIVVDKNQVYITAFPDVYIYSLADSRLIKKFGDKGEGPKQFSRYAVPYLHKGRLVFADQNRMLFFSTGGDYISEIKAKSMINWGAVPIAEGFVAKSRTKIDNLQYDTLNLYDASINKIKEICTYKFFFQDAGGGKKCDAVELRGIQFQVYGDRIYFKRGKDFVIDVFDKKGNKIHTIEREYKKIKITDADKARYHDYFKTTPPWKRMYDDTIKKEVYFDDYFPAIQTFVVVDEKIYVLTYEKKERESRCVILDLKGKVLKEVFLPIDQGDDEWFHYSLAKIVTRASPNPTFAIKGDMLYRLVENDSTESWELQISPIQ